MTRSIINNVISTIIDASYLYYYNDAIYLKSSDKPYTINNLETDLFKFFSNEYFSSNETTDLYDTLKHNLKRCDTQPMFQIIENKDYDKPTYEYFSKYPKLLTYIKQIYVKNDKDFLIILGNKDSGKTTFIHNLINTLRLTVSNTQINQWMSGSFDKNICWIDELTKNEYIDNQTVNLIKNLTGAVGKIQINPKYGKTKDIESNCKIIITTNYLPRLNYKDEAFISRMKFIRFDEKNKIDTIPVMFCKNTLYTMIMSANDEYKHDQEFIDYINDLNPIKRFINTNPISVTYDRYRFWCNDEKIKHIGKSEFEREVENVK